MLPSKLVNAFIVFLGCIAAVNLGSFLSYTGDFGIYLLIIAVPTTLFALANNFPLLLAFVVWFPFPLPVPGMKLPLTVPLLALLGILSLFRVCMTRALSYVPSCNWWIFACYAWVPLRFLLKPVTKLGGNFSGGAGISGLTSYFGFISTAGLILLLGTVINTREKVIQAVVWSSRLCLFWAVCMLGAAFNPVIHTFFVAVGGFNAGEIVPGIYRIVQLPGYAYVLLGNAFCPYLFQIKKLKALRCVLFGLFCIFLIILGGNRSNLVASLVFLALLLVLNRRVVLGLFVSSTLFVILAVSTVLLQNVSEEQMPGFARILGVFSSHIDDASGGTASANWRYAVWDSGLKKIMDHPMVGNGFGNLPKHLDPVNTHLTADETDYEVVLAMGEAHNGFITAAYGFGIPMALGLTLAMAWRVLVHARAALLQDSRDLELREFHAFTAAFGAGSFVLIYSALDLSCVFIWFYISLGFVMTRLTRKQQPAPTFGGEKAFYPTLAQYGAN